MGRKKDWKSWLQSNGRESKQKSMVTDLPTSEEKKSKYNNSVVWYDGLKFASELECYCYKSLKGSSFQFEFQKTVTIQEGFKRGKAFDVVSQSVWAKDLGVLRQGKERAIKMILDFFLQFEDFDVIIDTKGCATADWLVKAKMLEFQLAQKEKPTLFFTPSNENEVLVVISKLKEYARKY